jgi:hypothetical protein
MPTIDIQPIQDGGDLVTTYETTVTTTLTDYTFSTIQETTFVINEGVQHIVVI